MSCFITNCLRLIHRPDIGPIPAVQFVSAYAHEKNPNEDMAESVSFYILNPDKLRSRAPLKYAFVRDRIMHGSMFLATVRADLTFEVLNLHPNYEYPGKICRVDIGVRGRPEEDKAVTIELGLAPKEAANGSEAAAEESGQPPRGYLRMMSEIGTFQELHLSAVDDAVDADGRRRRGTVLRGEITISRFAKAGVWAPQNISVTDEVGNERHEGIHDFGWRLLLDNPLEVTGPPRLVPGSLQLSLADVDARAHRNKQAGGGENDEKTDDGAEDDEKWEDGKAHRVQRLVVTWKVLPHTALSESSVCAYSMRN
jgi:hypothetical protein